MRWLRHEGKYNRFKNTAVGKKHIIKRESLSEKSVFTAKISSAFNTPILLAKGKCKTLVSSRFRSIEKEPQLQYTSYHNHGSYLVGEGGFGPPKSVTTDLQSAPFGRSGIPPYPMELRCSKATGAGDRSRTNNLLITNQLLCH